MLRQILDFLKKVNTSPKFLKMAESLTPLSLGKRPPETEGEDTAKKQSKKKKKKHVVQLGQSEGCKRKIAMLVAYNGAGYYGVQINPGFPTIESEFFPALVKVGAIPQEHADTPSKMWFQRGSRTDKGVSAAGQIFSMKIILVPDLIQKLNDVLPAQIRAIGFVRTTNSFDSKNWCDGRTYMYMMPTFAFAPFEKFITDEYRTTPEILERVRAVLNKFVGTHKFHNFTSGVKYEQASASRYIIKFECSEPYIREGIEFVTLQVKGQSFMLHHIRKMIGLTIAILRGYCGETTIESCWGPDKVDVPKAPGLGLVLEALHFDGYNRKWGNDGVHASIDWSPYQEMVEKFKEEHIISYIVSQEKSERVMFNWLRTLQYHNFDQPRLEGPERPWVKTLNVLAEKSPNQRATEQSSPTPERTTPERTTNISTDIPQPNPSANSDLMEQNTQSANSCVMNDNKSDNSSGNLNSASAPESQVDDLPVTDCTVMDIHSPKLETEDLNKSNHITASSDRDDETLKNVSQSQS